MSIFVIVNCVEGIVNSVCLRRTRKDAIGYGVELAAEQCDSKRKEIRAEFARDSSFVSHNGDIVLTIHKCELPDKIE
jgi:hypothetical protein